MVIGLTYKSKCKVRKRCEFCLKPVNEDDGVFCNSHILWWSRLIDEFKKGEGKA